MVGLHTASALDLDTLSVPLTEASAQLSDNLRSPTIKQGQSLQGPCADPLELHRRSYFTKQCGIRGQNLAFD